jgi:hypothetical protein
VTTAARGVLVVLAALAVGGPAAAQGSLPVAVDTVVAIDHSADADVPDTTGVLFDAVASVGLGRGFEAFVRPIAQRLDRGTTAEWNRQIWIATLRYQRPGDVGLRVDAGLIPSPIGLANLMLRPHLNPTIALPSALSAALPLAGAPRTTLLGFIYGYGASATVSGSRWDARAAVIDASPVRPRRIFAEAGQNPPRFGTVVLGGGVTPFVGVRVGASVTSSGWQRAGESPGITADRDVTVVTLESQVEFRHTKLQGEWVRDSFETATGRQHASGGWVQAQQTLTPRWFAAARIEQIAAPQVSPLGATVNLRLTSVEGTVGFRLTPELTFRIGHRARRTFNAPTYDNQILMSAVWWKRW